MLNQNDVYLHRRADTGAVFYVGIGKRGRATSRSGRTTHWKNIVAKHGLEIQYVVRDVDRATAVELEQFLIDWVGRERVGGPLINITDGGEGCPGRDKGKSLSQEHKAKLAAAKIGTKQSPDTVAKRIAKVKGQKRTKEQREVFRLIARERKPEHLQKIATALRGKKLSAEHIRSIRMVRGRAIDADNGMRFECAADAVDWLRANGWPKAAAANIIKTCRGERPAAYGMKWLYASGI